MHVGPGRRLDSRELVLRARQLPGGVGVHCGVGVLGERDRDADGEASDEHHVCGVGPLGVAGGGFGRGFNTAPSGGGFESLVVVGGDFAATGITAGGFAAASSANAGGGSMSSATGSGAMSVALLGEGINGSMQSVISNSSHEEEKKSLQVFKISPDSKTIAFLGNEGCILLVSTKTKEPIGTLKMNGSARSVAFTNVGHQLLSSGGDGHIYHWDLKIRSCFHKGGDEGCLTDTVLSVPLLVQTVGL